MRLIDADLLGLTDMEIIMCNGDYKEALKMLIDKIEHAPTIEQPHWIPMTERPPEVDVDVLVTEDTGGMKEVLIDSCWVDGDTERALWYTSLNVTAWMPLPEPYKGEEG